MKKLLQIFNTLSAFFSFLLLGFLFVRFFKRFKARYGGFRKPGLMTGKTKYFSSQKGLSTDSQKYQLEEFNSRQNQILGLFEESPELEMQDIMKNIKGATERTFRRDLLLMQKKGLVTKMGTTKSVKYQYLK